ncbi:hypothetical protein [Microvirga sp. VF16]|uniref:hypothetical protein n=1 Tax=Microvirga sp. VF16 TaxID=2807101 RepID=UPI00193C96DC|nr:hypothetical protein [Microvirga sp. VF16]QRM35722.1 hypothetical protein JO965_43740 [Microvirga sp. VF16]
MTLPWGEAGTTGDSVDLAFLVLAVKVALDVPQLRRSAPRMAEIPFAADRRYATSVNRHGDDHHVHGKGAAEVLIPLCHGSDQAEPSRRPRRWPGTAIVS